MKTIHYLTMATLAIMAWSLSACYTANSPWEGPDIPSQSPGQAGHPAGTPSAPAQLFTAQTTVAEVIADPALGDFGRLLFPVDRNVPSSMTLAQVSTSGVYMWYPYIQLDKTIEVLEYLRTEAVAGERIFHSIYTPDEIASDPSKADTGIPLGRLGWRADGRHPRQPVYSRPHHGRPVPSAGCRRHHAVHRLLRRLSC